MLLLIFFSVFVGAEDTPKYIISTYNHWLICNWPLGEIKVILILLACV